MHFRDETTNVLIGGYLSETGRTRGLRGGAELR